MVDRWDLHSATCKQTSPGKAIHSRRVIEPGGLCWQEQLIAFLRAVRLQQKEKRMRLLLFVRAV